MKAVVVYGLPGVGKTTYTLAQLQRGDLMLDVDRLFASISGLPMHDKPECLLPFVCAARDAILDRLCRPSSIGTAWIVTADERQAERWSRRFHARFLEVRVDEAERKRRLESRWATLAQTKELRDHMSNQYDSGGV